MKKDIKRAKGVTNNNPVMSHGTSNAHVHGANRSVAQPLPTSKVDEVKEKATASEEEKAEALKRNSQKGKDHKSA